MAEPNKPKQAIEPKISEDHEEVLLLKGVMEKGCTELGNILCSLESNETLVKQKNYLKNENILCIGIRVLNFNQNAKGQLNTIDTCSRHLLRIDHVAKYIEDFRNKIHSGKTEIDWLLAMKSMSGDGGNTKLVLKMKNAIKKRSPETNVAHKTDIRDVSPNKSAAIIANSPADSIGSSDGALGTFKRDADELESESPPKPKKMKLSIGKDGSETESITLNIDRANVNFKLVTEMCGAQITIEMN